ncbi:iron-sulfur cluster assembly accessory protein [Marinomonas sp. 15G1-11]|uniref:Iron-sulfur cluster assembly accessory protein n=1 Tax=Marinomonas phaeophyticola TaxID=3004091 RepID=A0ABT4JY23_9GAMM|nr:iron-sulfur cluster assembly accessory protein [Marinomonas sp. 15G1-11]MCZ2723120.1 iron-sulfur cluster assembly accessory protein [Marinomonas sp. 15G1-11]
MSATTFDPSVDLAQPVTLTQAAEQYFAKKLASQADKLIRVSTKVSGCTGFAYVLDMVESIEDGDQLLHFGDVTVAVDMKAMDLIKGTEIDLVQEGINHVIKFNNPNVVAECGCGESFSVS